MPRTSRARKHLAPQVRSPADYGTFDGTVCARWLDDGRFMALCQPLVFTQRGGKVWTAPVGTRTDGATIPPIFWSVIGGPFEGQYRTAAVNHDYECCVKHEAWQDVHRMFFDGMMAKGEALWRANLMYFAAYFFGPRWLDKTGRPDRGFTEGDVARAAKYFQYKPATTLPDIETLTRAALRQHSVAIPRSIPGAKLLRDTKKIQPVDRVGPCIEPGAC